MIERGSTFRIACKTLRRIFERQNDVPALFVAECCHIGGQYSTQSQVLYNAYQAWCAANGHKPQSSTSVANEWQRLRFERYARVARRLARRRAD